MSLQSSLESVASVAANPLQPTAGLDIAASIMQNSKLARSIKTNSVNSFMFRFILFTSISLIIMFLVFGLVQLGLDDA